MLERELERALWYTDAARKAEAIERREATRRRHIRMGLIPQRDMAAVGSLGGKAFKAKYGMKEIASLAGKARGRQLSASPPAVRRAQTRKATIAWKKMARDRKRAKIHARDSRVRAKRKRRGA